MLLLRELPLEDVELLRRRAQVLQLRSLFSLHRSRRFSSAATNDRRPRTWRSRSPLIQAVLGRALIVEHNPVVILHLCGEQRPEARLDTLALHRAPRARIRCGVRERTRRCGERTRRHGQRRRWDCIVRRCSRRRRIRRCCCAVRQLLLELRNLRLERVVLRRRLLERSAQSFDLLHLFGKDLLVAKEVLARLSRLLLLARESRLLCRELRFQVAHDAHLLLEQARLLRAEARERRSQGCRRRTIERARHNHGIFAAFRRE
mmetsp:Transcript_23539/g.76580  ORF Transcript_23539/g.76580 Transcript_23539/m.76580 type:complete len:261 (+) Transcript_23539:3031-3813(+)